VSADLRREPFRLLFPLGALIAIVGVLPWLLFGTGMTRMWLGTYHALTLTQGFLLAVAAGFLGTMIPRRTGGRPLSTGQLALLAGALVVIPPALFGDHLALAEVAYLAALVTLAGFALSRLRHSQQTPPPSFVLIPLALVDGALGALLLIAFSLGAPASLLAPGRALVEEGVLLPLVMALAPMLTPIILDGEAAPQTRSRRFHLVLAALFLASFVVQGRIGTGVRGLCAAVEIGLVAAIWRTPRAPGLHRRLYQLAMAMVPMGLVLAALVPPFRVPLLHLSFIGGLSLLVFAVGAHVTFLHTGHDELARRRPWPIALVGALTVAAALIRAGAERFCAAHYFVALASAAALWLTAATLWTLYLAPMLLGRRHA
jgi:uncharacterized protein involved in response to NO